jgi:hypothetical protein
MLPEPFADRLAERQADLAPAERRAAEHLAVAGPEAALLGGRAGRRIGTSDATVVRTAKALGYRAWASSVGPSPPSAPIRPRRPTAAHPRSRSRRPAARHRRQRPRRRPRRPDPERDPRRLPPLRRRHPRRQPKDRLARHRAVGVLGRLWRPAGRADRRAEPGSRPWGLVRRRAAHLAPGDAVVVPPTAARRYVRPSNAPHVSSCPSS